MRKRRVSSASKFLSTKVRPKGASVGNLIQNIKTAKKDVKKVVKKAVKIITTPAKRKRRKKAL